MGGESKIGVFETNNVGSYTGYKHPPLSQNLGFQAGFPLPFYFFVAKQTYRSTPGEAATEYDAEAASLGKAAAEFWVAAFGLSKIDPTVDGC